METRIRPEDVTRVDLPEGSLLTPAIRDKSSVIGRRLILLLLKGDYVLPKDIGAEGGDNFPPVMRAVQIRQGKIKEDTEKFSPGDRVDVFAVTDRQPAPNRVTTPVLSGVTVISCQALPQGRSGRVQTTILLLSTADAEKLAAVRLRSRVALRMTATHERSCSTTSHPLKV